MSQLNFTKETLKIEQISIATFWLIVTGLSATGLAWMQNLARTTGNQTLATAANSFLILFFISIITEVFIYIFYRHRFWGERTEGSSLGISFLSFYLFGSAWYILTNTDILSIIQPNSLLSQAASTGSLTRFQEIFLNVFMAPTIEENFFRLALPILLYITILGIQRSFETELIQNKKIALVVATLLSSGAFAIFHTGQLGNTQFTIQALIFATILSALFLGDLFFNTIKGIAIVPASLVGIHMANNIKFYGLTEVVTVLSGNLFGITILALLGIGLISAIETGLDIIS